MPSWPAIWGCSSMFILTRVTLPPESATAFSKAGASCLQGPHHGAQKSTRTGWRVDAVNTSARNEAAVTSLTAEAALVWGAIAPLTFAISVHLQPEAPARPARSHFCRPRWRARAFYSTGGRFLAERHDQRLVAGGAQEFDEVGARKPGGAGIDQGMKVEPLMAHHRFVEDDANLSGFIVDRAERRDRARADAPHFFQELGGAEGDAPLRADLLMHALEIDCGRLAQDQQEQ